MDHCSWTQTCPQAVGCILDIRNIHDEVVDFCILRHPPRCPWESIWTIDRIDKLTFLQNLKVQTKCLKKGEKITRLQCGFLDRIFEENFSLKIDECDFFEAFSKTLILDLGPLTLPCYICHIFCWCCHFHRSHITKHHCPHVETFLMLMMVAIVGLCKGCRQSNFHASAFHAS